MKRRMRTIWILCAILAVVAAGYITLRLTEDPWEDGIWFDFGRGEQIETIHLENTYGEFDFTKDADGWLVECEGTYRANDRKMELFLSALEEFKVLRVLEEDSPEYGLNDSRARVRFTTSRGQEHEFSLGNVTMNASDAYVRDEKTGQVFITDGASAAQLTGSITAYRYKEVFTVDKENLQEIAFYRNGNPVVTLNNADGEKWMITKPYQAPARTVEMDEFLVSLRKWRIAGYADTAILDDAAMGLTNPSSTLIVTDREGNTQTLVFGRSAETTTFVRIGGKDEVVLLYNTDIDFSMMDADTLLFVAPFKMAVDQVASIRVSVSTGDYLFEIDPATGLVKCNGQYIDEKDFTGIFFKYISLNADGADLSQVVKPGEAVAYLKTVKLDGTEVEMTLYGRNEGTCYMELNGEMIYYLETAKMVGLLERIEAALQK